MLPPDNTTTRSYGGLGLGWAIVRQLTELHGGTVTVASPGIGQGTIFIVKLPIIIIHEPLSEQEVLDLIAQVDGSIDEQPTLEGLQIFSRRKSLAIVKKEMIGFK